MFDVVENTLSVDDIPDECCDGVVVETAVDLFVSIEVFDIIIDESFAGVEVDVCVVNDTSDE
jgi:hypothetical protein